MNNTDPYLWYNRFVLERMFISSSRFSLSGNTYTLYLRDLFGKNKFDQVYRLLKQIIRSNLCVLTNSAEKLL